MSNGLLSGLGNRVKTGFNQLGYQDPYQSQIGGGMAGLLAGLQGASRGMINQKKDEETRKAALLKQGLDPSRMGDAEYLAEQAANPLVAGKDRGSTGKYFSDVDSMVKQGIIDEEYANARKKERLLSDAKGTQFYYDKSFNTEQPKKQLSRQYDPETAGLVEQAKTDVKVEAERAKEARTAQKESGQVYSAIDNVRNILSETPEVVGRLSEMKAYLGDVTGGRLGFNPQDMQTRGKIDRSVKEIANGLIAKARNAGQTGINTMAEIRQAVGNISTASSAEELIGALETLEASSMKLDDYYRTQGGKQESFEDLWGE